MLTNTRKDKENSLLHILTSLPIGAFPSKVSQNVEFGSLSCLCAVSGKHKPLRDPTFTVESLIVSQIAVRTSLDSRTLWVSTGIACRIGQGLGLHRDGDALSLSVFETEIRRRVWWQIIILDFRAAELSGSGRLADFSLFDTKPPSNIDDSDLWVGQSQDELESTVRGRGGHARATEMINVALRCEIGSFWKEQMQKDSITFDPQRGPQFLHGIRPRPWDGDMAYRDHLINELEKRLEDKYLRYCDPGKPQELFAHIYGRAAIASMRLLAHHPRRWDNPRDTQHEERELLHNLCIRLVDYDLLYHSTQALQPYAWHVDDSFQWQALIYLLRQLHEHPLVNATAAWDRIDRVFQYHPCIMLVNNPLHSAIQRLTVKAWCARNSALRDAGEGRDISIPPHISELILQSMTPSMQDQSPHSEGVGWPATTQAHKRRGPREASKLLNESPVITEESDDQLTRHSYINTEQDEWNMDWAAWDTLIQDYEGVNMFS